MWSDGCVGCIRLALTWSICQVVLGERKEEWGEGDKEIGDGGQQDRQTEVGGV